MVLEVLQWYVGAIISILFVLVSHFCMLNQTSFSKSGTCLFEVARRASYTFMVSLLLLSWGDPDVCLDAGGIMEGCRYWAGPSERLDLVLCLWIEHWYCWREITWLCGLAALPGCDLWCSFDFLCLPVVLQSFGLPLLLFPDVDNSFSYHPFLAMSSLEVSAHSISPYHTPPSVCVCIFPLLLLV